MVGVSGLLAYTVRQRSREIGVRTALGAPRVAIVAMFLRRGVMLIGTGTSRGVLIAIAVSRLMRRLMRSILLDVAATDVPSFIAATAVVTIAAVIARRQAGSAVGAQTSAMMAGNSFGHRDASFVGSRPTSSA